MPDGMITAHSVLTYGHISAPLPLGSPPPAPVGRWSTVDPLSAGICPESSLCPLTIFGEQADANILSASRSALLHAMILARNLSKLLPRRYTPTISSQPVESNQFTRCQNDQQHRSGLGTRRWNDRTAVFKFHHNIP